MMKTTKILISICVVLFLTAIKMNAQVTIGSQNAPNASAALDLQTTNKGLLLPRVALTSATAAAPLTAHVAGMTVYNTATAGSGTNAVTPGQYYNDGSKWIRIQEYSEPIEQTFMVWVNSANPNTATAFDDVSYYDEDGGINPSFTNDNSLKAKTNYLYIGTDGSNWTYNGTTYITYKAVAATEWYLAGSTVDAGNNKTSSITRSGKVGIGGNAPSSAALFVSNNKYDTNTIPTSMNAWFGASPSVTKTGTYNTMSIYNQNHLVVSKGVTNSGQYRGITNATYRRGAADGGYLETLTGIYNTWGHILGEGLEDAETNVAYGILSQPQAGRGKINSAYDFRARNYDVPANVINQYGVFIEGSGKTNYFGGKLGIGTFTPKDKLQIVGGGFHVGETPTSGVLYYGNSDVDGAMGIQGRFAVQHSGTSANLYLSKNKNLTSGGSVGNLYYAMFAVGATGVDTPTYIGSIRANATGDGIAFNTTSDKRLKENITNTHYSLSDLMKISVKDYNFKSDETKTVQTGFLAQDLYEVYPEAVSVGGENAQENPWAVDYGKVTPLLVKAIQDQQKIIEQLEARIKALESK